MLFLVVIIIIVVVVVIRKQKATLPLQMPVDIELRANGTSTTTAVTNPVFTLYEGSAAVDDVYETAYSNGPWDAKQFYGRVVGTEMDQWGLDDDPLANLDQVSTVSLKVAIEEAAVHCSILWQPNPMIFSFEDPVDDALDFGRALLAGQVVNQHGVQAKTLPDGFNAENGATLHVYTQDTPLYGGLNGALGGWGKGNPQGKAAIPHYLSYAKIFRTTCSMLPPFAGRLFRGISKSVDVVLEGKGIGDVIQFNAVTSTSKDPAVVRDAQFLGGEHCTVLQLAVFSGVQISQFSAYTSEDEVLILPGAKFKIHGIQRSKKKSNVFEVQLRQVSSDYAVVPGSCTTVYSTPDQLDADPLSLYSSICPLYENIDLYLAPGGSVTLPPFVFDESFGKYGMVVSVDQPFYDLASDLSQPLYDLATQANLAKPFYDKASSSNIDVLAATTNSAGVSAVYSIPLDTGNDFATYDRVRAETMPSNSHAVYATQAAPKNVARKRSSTISAVLNAATSTQNASNVSRARTATLGRDTATLPAVRPVEGRYQNQDVVAAAEDTCAIPYDEGASSRPPVNDSRARTVTLGWGGKGRQPLNAHGKLKGRGSAGPSKVSNLPAKCVVQPVEGRYQNQVAIDSFATSKHSTLQSRIDRKDPSRTSGTYGFESTSPFGGGIGVGDSGRGGTTAKHKASMYEGFGVEDVDSDIDI